MPDEVLTQSRLEHIASTLSDRDRNIISDIKKCRYLTTKQIQRLHYTDTVTPAVGVRKANRALNKLRDMGLTEALPRRIGGVRSGSGSLVWCITEGGERLLRINSKGEYLRKRFFMPSPYFLAHTLSVAECYVQLTEICNRNSLKLDNAELEPKCWREYIYKDVVVKLLPDLFAATHNNGYEDRWFIEVDLDTEAPMRIAEKCQRYHDYYRKGHEQKQYGVFPLVVWIVPNTVRKESLTAYLRNTFATKPNIFIVITPDELEPLIRHGVEGSASC